MQIAMSRMGSTISNHGTRARLSLTMIVYIIISSCEASSPDNLTLLNQPGVIGVWRRPSNYSDFRSDSARRYYDVWPEYNDDSAFEFPCEDRKSRLMLANFTYSVHGGLVRSLPYYDLGIVYQYRPYWRRPNESCFGCAAVDFVGYPMIYCERGDLTMLYYHRAKKTIFEGVWFGIAMVAIQQIAFLILGLLIPVYLVTHRTLQGLPTIAAKHLQGLNWAVTLIEWLHLLALATAGYLLVEGYGHSDPAHDWKSKAMNTLAYYYRVQTACAFVSSFLRQCANTVKVINPGNLPGGAPSTTSSRSSSEKRHTEMLIGQVVVCVVMVEYLYLSDDTYMDFMIQVVFAVVTVAVTVSMSLVISVAAQSVVELGKPLWKQRKPLWKKVKLGVGAIVGGNSQPPPPRPASSQP